MKKRTARDVFDEIAEIYNLPMLRDGDMTAERFAKKYSKPEKPISETAAYSKLSRAVKAGKLRIFYAFDPRKNRRVSVFSEK